MPQASSPGAIGVRNMPRVDGQVIRIDVGSGFPQSGQPWRASFPSEFRTSSPRTEGGLAARTPRWSCIRPPQPLR